MASSVKQAPLTICVFAALLLVSSTLAISDSPFIVAHKKATLQRLKSGAERVSISIDIYNRGSEVAYNVSLTDDSWAQDVFHLVNGETYKSWEILDAGALVSHSFELESKEKRIVQGEPALVTFRVPMKAELQVAYSNSIPPLDLLADRPPEDKFAWTKSILANYGSQVSAISIVLLFAYLIAAPSTSSAAKGSKKRR